MSPLVSTFKLSYFGLKLEKLTQGELDDDLPPIQSPYLFINYYSGM